MSDFKFLLVIFILWRVLLFIPLIAGQNLLTYRVGNEFTNILNKVSPDSLLKNDLVYPWANFDGVHYLTIASQGYTTDGRFFPLYPLLIWIVSAFFGHTSYHGLSQFLSGFLIANISFFMALLLLYRRSYLIFAILAFLLPSLSGTFSGLPRYVVVLFPIFIILAQLKNNFFKISYSLFSAALLFVLMMFFSRGYFVA